MQGKVEVSGVNTARLKVLNNEQTMELLRRTKAGDKKAREELINGNLRLVLSVIQKFSSRGENPDDLFQVGCVGLIKAIDGFDLSQPVRFSTYGVPMIIGEIRRYLDVYKRQDEGDAGRRELSRSVPLPGSSRGGEPGPLCSDARRRVPGWRYDPAGQDRPCLRQLQYA